MAQKRSEPVAGECQIGANGQHYEFVLKERIVSNATKNINDKKQ
jgi:hypothetical protein